ncbi:NAD-dependent epimerase/dehydratase family protein [Actinophytocola algeriensis]|uniref:Nucleoside-diphosphate-sugar epimerase n=1 Tax=Actinophytocola algeriensis TaxID=1768010 RepID=A0A7W7QCR5_9PSEU|nr:NAD-dependent epimerase/dehydratase family protein [Actinophytocola algeriensis]MBB4911169.1 nucleoside-diphosphate-sugar epimerase [Actinophytocola algeriensis]MBE1479108.1 nucleoside-diphosphate-sugar epimerase [Actinophytocola algeriensis]
MAERVLVTGASGYIARQVIADLRAHGYAVRGTARRPVDGLDDVVTADLAADAGWAEAVAGCDHVLHVASPFPVGRPNSDDELVRPAVDGTLRVLRAAVAAGVKRVVLTSSTSAIASGHRDGRVRTEADWSDVDRSPAYAKSKTLAERAAWDFARESGLELVALNPGLVLGPLTGPGVNTSVDVVRRLLVRDVPGSPKIGFSLVDVRDVAVAHRLAMESPIAPGNRYILAGDHLGMREIAAVLAEEFNPRGYRVPTGSMPTWLLRLVALFDPSVRQALDFVGRPELVTAEKARSELAWTMRPARDTIIDTANSLIDMGVVAIRSKKEVAV